VGFQWIMIGQEKNIREGIDFRQYGPKGWQWTPILLAGLCGKYKTIIMILIKKSVTIMILVETIYEY
jgi:hypothetical protein